MKPGEGRIGIGQVVEVVDSDVTRRFNHGFAVAWPAEPDLLDVKIGNVLALLEGSTRTGYVDVVQDPSSGPAAAIDNMHQVELAIWRSLSLHDADFAAAGS